MKVSGEVEVGDMTTLVHQGGSNCMYATGYFAGTGSHLHPRDTVDEIKGTRVKCVALLARRARVQPGRCNVSRAVDVHVVLSTWTCESRTPECTYDDGECTSDRHRKHGTRFHREKHAVEVSCGVLHVKQGVHG
jgi:hypothetical protein